MIEGEKIILDRVEEKHLPQLLEWRNDPENRKFYREYRVLTIEDKKKWYNDKILNFCIEQQNFPSLSETKTTEVWDMVLTCLEPL